MSDLDEWFSTGHLPIHDRIINEVNSIKNINCMILMFFVCIVAGKYRIIIEDSRAVTPLSLLGIDRRIA